MKRVEDYPHVAESLKGARLALGRAASRKCDYWANMEEKRRAVYLKRAGGIPYKAWSSYNTDEKVAIEREVSRVAKLAHADAEMLGVMW